MEVEKEINQLRSELDKAFVLIKRLQEENSVLKNENRRLRQEVQTLKDPLAKNC